MNVLILTPDAVGSTLLQRLLTIYMQFHRFDQPVINIHELTNGINKFYSPEFNQELIGRSPQWGYKQSMKEIVDLLESVDHYKTARLALYHIRRREDSQADQLSFYQYLNDNFFIIACLRENWLEYAISHAFNNVTKRLNVYLPSEKINSFYGLYRSGVEIQPEQIFTSLNRYRDYLDWMDQHFSVGSYFSYETHVPNIERYILNLPVFGAQNQRLTWKDTFGLEFEEWNRCHYYKSDIGSLALRAPEEFLQLEHSASEPANTTAVSLLHNLLPTAHKNFLEQHNHQYQQTVLSIIKMRNLGIIPNTVPIKKQTLMEKLHMVRNLDQCVDAYNQWVEQNPGRTQAVTLGQLQQRAQVEYSSLWDSTKLNWTPPGQLPNQQ